jgi:hypothetical protein
MKGKTTIWEHALQFIGFKGVICHAYGAFKEKSLKLCTFFPLTVGDLRGDNPLL